MGFGGLSEGALVRAVHVGLVCPPRRLVQHDVRTRPAEVCRHPPLPLRILTNSVTLMGPGRDLDPACALIIIYR